jgi:hypothetical protein
MATIMTTRFQGSQAEVEDDDDEEDRLSESATHKSGSGQTRA